MVNTAIDTPYLVADGVSKRFGDTVVLDLLTIGVGRGEFVSLLGPSGCGKTTLLRLVAGLLKSDSGRIELGGRVISDLPPHRRNVGVVFQNYALFPHLNVFENIAFGLRARGAAESQVAETVSRFLALVKLSDYADRPATTLSGGQQQRVAVARALATHPDILLLDEPFSALDRQLREGMQIELRALLRELGITAIFVTHDQEEALVMSDRIAVMHKGAIEQFDTPQAIHGSPSSRFVLDFMGSSVTMEGKVTGTADGLCMVETADGFLRVSGGFIRGADVVVATRPEHIRLVAEPANRPDANTLEVSLTDHIFFGARTVAHLKTRSGGKLKADVAAGDIAAARAQDRLYAEWRVDETMVFPAETGR